MDISKKDVKVCIRLPGGRGGRYRNEVTTFGSMTAQILELRAFLIEQQVTMVVMESTGDYWKPFYYVLEGGPFELMLVNPRHVKGVPGRKTDVSDAQWLADLAAHGLVRGSLVPPPPIRVLRDLTRTHADLTKDRTREYNRLESVLQDAGIKLTSVASKITGVSCRLMLDALVAGERNPKVLADLAKASLREKRDQLTLAMTGRFTDHHAFLVRLHLHVIDEQTAAIDEVTTKIEVVTEPFRAQIALLETIPGVSTQIAYVIIAETGGDMTKFPSAAHLASWAGVCPGHNQSADVTKKAKTRPGNSYLKGALGQAAMSSMQVNDTFLQDRHGRLRNRIGGLKTIVALEHSILRSAWHMLSNNQPYRELGAGYHQRRHPQRAIQSIKRQAARLGYNVRFDLIHNPSDPKSNITTELHNGRPTVQHALRGAWHGDFRVNFDCGAPRGAALFEWR
jgi:transposase